MASDTSGARVPRNGAGAAPPGGGAERVAAWLVERSGWVLGAVVLLTFLLALPTVWLPPTAMASMEPEGPVFEASRLSSHRFAPAVHRFVFLVESRQGNLLAAEPLRELWRNTQTLRDDAGVGPKLATGTDPRSRASIEGISSVADAVDALLQSRTSSGLEEASAEQVDEAVRALLGLRSPAELGLSAHTARQPDGSWTAPAAVLYLFADNEALGGGPSAAMIGDDDLPKEQFGRQALALLRGQQQHYRAWGIAIDVNLTSAEQGKAAGPFIGWTILAVLLLVGVAFRSYWAVALCGSALGALMIWLQGLSNLMGLESSQILATIVPIAMISFGIDFALHAVGRYREHRREGLAPRRALLVGLSGVLAALLLAAASDAAAFLSNTTTGIEALVQFGLAAALAQIAALAILGLAVPLALMRIEGRMGERTWSRRAKALGAVGALAAALGAMTAVIWLVFLDVELGIALLALHLLAFVVGPAAVVGRRRSRAPAPAPAASAAGGGWPWVGRLVVALARRRRLVLPVTLAGTLGCAYFATQVRARFDVRDFFAADSDFVVGLERLDYHLGSRGGEPALIYVEADLTRPEVIRALRRFRDELAELPTERLARDDAGKVQIDAGVLTVIRQARAAQAAGEAVQAKTVPPPAGAGQGGGLYSAERLTALYDVALADGLAAAGGEPPRSPSSIAELLWRSPDGSRYATRLVVRLPRSGEQENLAAARREIEPLVSQLSAALRQLDPEATAALTGAPIVRQASLEAVLRAFRLSLPVAVLLCLLVAASFMRSLRLAAVSTVPILLVVAWLYAAMYALDMPVNVVSATIGAVSIGIGIDFAVHFTMRYREERRGGLIRDEALGRAGSGTGTALLTSALSSIMGFSILALAPMPLFASYGLLTAVMLAMAAVATLLVLPSLLLLVEPARSEPAHSR